MIPMTYPNIKMGLLLTLKMLKIKTESSTTPPKSIILPISKFGSSIHADTINAFQLKFNHTKGKRKGALEFRSRIDERNRNRYPWSASRLKFMFQIIYYSDDKNIKINISDQFWDILWEKKDIDLIHFDHSDKCFLSF